MALGSVKFTSFGAGWCPSDDQVSGRKNALLQMTNVELDKNGALALIGGSSVQGTPYAHPATDIFSTFLGATREDYVADTTGQVLRNGASLLTGGSTTRTAFGVAFNYVLIASGAQLKKDNGTNLYNLGIGVPTVAPTISPITYFAQAFEVSPGGYSIVAVVGTASSATEFVTMTTVSSGSAFQAVVQSTSILGSPRNMNKLVPTGFPTISTVGTPNDLVQVTLSSTTLGSLALITSIEIDILLDATDPSGDVVADFYALIESGADILTPVSTITNPTSSTEQSVIFWKRSDFLRIGGGAVDWSTVTGFRIILNSSAAITVTIDIPLSTGFQGGDAALTSDATYVQVNARLDGSYQGLSIAGPSVVAPSFNNTLAYTVLPQVPTDPQVTDIYIYRIDGGLNAYYQVLHFTAANWTTAQVDTFSDQNALTLGITLNVNLQEPSSIQPILSIVGPLEGRWWYFTASFAYPSDINDPDLIDPTLGIRISGSNAEQFFWAEMGNYKTIVIGTSRNAYLLTGTFVTLPDGTVDIFFGPLGNTTFPYPPITYDAAVWSGVIYYLAKDGWRSIDESGNCNLLVSPNTDILYRQTAAYGYGAVNLQFTPGTKRFPICIAKGKLWCSITGQNRLEVYDFIRTYWRPVVYGNNDCLALYPTQDGQILGFFGSVNTLNVIDNRGSLVTGNVKVLSPVLDNGTPRNRKDSINLRGRLYTGSSGSLSISIITDLGTVVINGITAPTVTDIVYDLSQLIDVAFGVNQHPRWYQLQLNSGLNPSNDLLVEELEIFFDERPLPVTYKIGYTNNFKSTSPKRLRSWPFMIDTRGQNVTFTPIGDGAAQTADATVFNTNEKRTVEFFVTSDYNFTDYSYTMLWSGTQPFELWDEIEPVIVETYPNAVKYWQVGPQHVFRYGRFKELSFRVIPTGTSINWNVLFKDNSILTGTLAVRPNVEDAYSFEMTKEVAGEIVRIEFKADEIFYPYYVRAKVARSGSDTDTDWIPL